VGTGSQLATHRSLTVAAIGRRLGSRRERLLFLVDLLIVAWLIWLFDAINNLAPVRQGLAGHDGQRVLDFERSLHLAPEHALNVWLAHRHTLSQIVVFWYENVHIVVALAVFAWLWWRRADVLDVMRPTLVIVNLIALAVFWSFPTAPPRMLAGGYVDLVAVAQHLPPWQLGATALHSNQLCALPSLHIAWATWSSIAAWRLSERRWVRALALLYPLVTSYAVMATANHYLADCLAGAAITATVYAVLNRPRIRRHLAWGSSSADGSDTVAPTRLSPVA
jgi:PAP2 superfamily